MSTKPGQLHFIRVIEGSSARKQTEQELIQLAHYDTVSNLPNRALFRDRLTQALAQAHRNSGMLAIMFLDLD